MRDAGTSSLRVGFIGLGSMGGALARRLLRQGLPLVVCDTNQALAESFVAQGARVASSPATLASQVDIAMACLPAPAISEAVACGEKGVFHGQGLKVYVEMSTIGAPCMEGIAARLAERGIGTLDAPVSGGPAGVANGNLTCMVSGATDDVDRAAVPLAAVADRLFHVGELPGQAQVLKLANNLLTAANLALASEMVHMARRAGIAAERAVEVINASSGRTRATEATFPQQILSGRFDIGATIAILHKDVALALAEARRLGAEHTGASGIEAAWRHAIDAGCGALDMSVIYRHIGDSHRLSAANKGLIK